jgi:Uncharacterized conserved protein
MLKKICLLLMMGIVFLSGAQVNAAEQNVLRGIVVTGEASLEKEPDQTTIYFMILTNKKTSEEAQAENAKITSRVYQAFLAEGIERKSWKTTQMTINPQYTYSGSKSKLTGYQMVHRVMMVLPGTEKAGRVVNLLVDSGVENIESIQFGLKDPKAAEREAIAAATREAREKGEIMAAASGARIIGVRYVGEPTSYGRSNAYMVAGRTSATGDVAMEQQVWASTIQVAARIQIHFELAE